MSDIPNPPPQKHTFGSSVSFDLEKPPEPKRRGKRDLDQEGTEHPLHEPSNRGEVVDCPGCGQEISEEEWLDALVGFVSGVRDFEVGDPVRARIVQTLRNTVTNMNMPHQRDVWELSVVAHLVDEFERIVQAETLRVSNDEVEANFSISEVQEMLQATEIETRSAMANEIWEDVVVQVQTVLEPKLRKQIEQELWGEFEAELHRRQEA